MLHARGTYIHHRSVGTFQNKFRLCEAIFLLLAADNAAGVFALGTFVGLFDDELHVADNVFVNLVEIIAVSTDFLFVLFFFQKEFDGDS